MMRYVKTALVRCILSGVATVASLWAPFYIARDVKIYMVWWGTPFIVTAAAIFIGLLYLTLWYLGECDF